MSNNTPNNTRTSHQNLTPTRRAVETKSSLKTTEFYVWLLVSAAILIAALVTDNGDDGQGFGADHAWQYVAFVTVGYLISRGLAKSGTRGHEDNDNNNSNH